MEYNELAYHHVVAAVIIVVGQSHLIKYELTVKIRSVDKLTTWHEKTI